MTVSRYAEERRLRDEMEREIRRRKKRLEFVVALVVNDFDVAAAITDTAQYGKWE